MLYQVLPKEDLLLFQVVVVEYNGNRFFWGVVWLFFARWPLHTQKSAKMKFNKIWNCPKCWKANIVPCESTAKELSNKWSHHRTSFTNHPRGVLSYITHTGMCRPRGYGTGFCAVWRRLYPFWSGIGYAFRGMNVLVVSIPNKKER